MKKLVTVLCLLTMMFVFSGCGKGAEADKIIQQQLKMKNELADDAEQGKVTLDEYTNRLVEIDKKLDELNLTSEEKDRAQEKYLDDFRKVSKRLSDAMVSGKK